MGFTVGWVEMGFTVGRVEMGFTLGWVEGRECKLSSAQVLHPWALTNKRYSVCFSSVTGSIFKPRFRLHLGTVQWDSDKTSFNPPMGLSILKSALYPLKGYFYSIICRAESWIFLRAFILLRECVTRFSTSSFFMIWTHLGPWLTVQRIFEFSFDFVEIFDHKVVSEVCNTPRR